jgi:predicted DNA binding CopG/RHH family protein
MAMKVHETKDILATSWKTNTIHEHKNSGLFCSGRQHKKKCYLLYLLCEVRKYGLSQREVQIRRRWYFMKKPLHLPEFKSEDQERDFWDKIDITEYFEPEDAKRFVFPNLKRTNRAISIRLPEPLIEEAKAKAEKLDVPYQRLMREVLNVAVNSSLDTRIPNTRRRVARVQPGAPGGLAQVFCRHGARSAMSHYSVAETPAVPPEALPR